MIMPDDLFRCPRCGLLRASEIVVVPGAIPWSALRCVRCGADGALVCDGRRSSRCRLRPASGQDDRGAGWCYFHGCAVEAGQPQAPMVALRGA